MQPNQYKHIEPITLPPRFFFLSVLVCLIFPATSHSQKKITDSLTNKKKAFETKVNFNEADTSYIKVLYELGRSYIYQIPDSTKDISERVLRLSQEARFEKGIAGGKLGLGLYHIFKGEFNKGFEHVDQAEISAERANADTLLLKSMNTKAMGQFMKGDYPEAYMECNRGKAYAEEVGNLEMQVFFTMNLATCFAILRDYDSALPYYEQALGLVSKSNDEAQKAQIAGNLAYMYLHTDQYEKAKINAKAAIEVLNREKYQAWESFAWATLGEVAIKERKYDEALEYFSKSEGLLATIEDMQRKAETLQGIADVYFLKGDFPKSLEYAKQAEDIAQNISYHNGIVKASELLYKLYIQNEDPKRALEYLSIAKHLSDSILESESRTKFLMLETQTRFNREKKLAEFENEKKLEKQRTLTYISIILFMALLVIVLLIRKNALNQKRANLSLQKTNETKDMLFGIIGHDLKAPIGTLQELLELYGSNEISEKEVAQLAPRLKQNVDHSSFVLNNLLFWAESQMNGIIPNQKPILVKKMADSVCKLYQTRIEEKSIDIQCSIDSNLEILADSVHFDIILRNIISNAIKYTPTSGSVYFNSTESAEMIEISICDTGLGMNESTISAILNDEPIKSKPGTAKEKGTGIGLKITQELLRINNGSLKVKSNGELGTCIYLYFQKT